MKFKIIICTFIGAGVSSLAFGQSSATLYGKLDVGYGVGNGGIYEGNEGLDSKFQQWGNSRSTSVWGLRGSEDLGNGLNVYFNLESEINPENGEHGDTLFSQASYVGIGGAFGSIQAGRQTTISSNIMGEFDVSGAPGLTSSLGNAGVSGDAQRFNDGTYDRLDSMLLYVSPDFSGFQLQAALTLKNDDILGLGADGKNLYSVGAQYTYAGLTIGAVYESKPVDMKDVSSSWGIGAKYDFGTFLISASYFDNHVKDDGRGFALGVSAPIGAFEVGAQIAYNTKAYSQTDGDKIKPLAWELFTTYDLSRRTQLYVQYGGMNNDAKEYNLASRKYSASFGIIHSF